MPKVFYQNKHNKTWLTLNSTDQKKVLANSVYPDEMAHMSHLIWIYTVCLLILLLFLNLNFSRVFYPLLTQSTPLQLKEEELTSNTFGRKG